jgi:hypothetical protein
MTKLLRCGLIGLFVPLLAVADDAGVGVVKDLLAQLWDYQRGNLLDKKYVAFDIPELLVNQYMGYLINTKARLGVTEAVIKITDKNKVQVTCNLDLQQIGVWAPTVINADSPLAGKNSLQVNATASVDITNGTAKVSILSASEAGGSTGMPVIQELLRIVAYNQPEHFEIDKPIKLPFNLTVALADGVVYGKTPRRTSQGR